ncbi:HEPN domain-containing protein [Bdellovibrionota bacterium FG-2]
MWKLLAEKAAGRYEDAEILLEHDRLETALEQGHLCLELIMKAALEKSGRTDYPKGASTGHDLAALAKIRIAGRTTIMSAVRSDSRIRPLFSALMSAWRMQYRYSKVPLEQDSMVELVGFYRRVYQWIRANFIQ